MVVIMMTTLRGRVDVVVKALSSWDSNEER